ncbi:alpha-beta hydrolase superfamily lysophospholipase [Halorubrum trapanicum]|uniref:Alpha-beta hydrolase superfamily lysophospholipase n=1 Tax=Halorubrum trapanicum TaxID=29284 RepID=A0A8J7R531_9EURY|nr:alpha/beta fold hydrolase [Halorubrum trapanicum]MBP1902139.1 alpha-beta hydrolase superfamily lysophospholipase [Halorubrum trapanicum]
MTRRDPVNRAQRRLARPARERFATRAVAFDADGATCRGTLYLPGGDADDPPVVVMAPGLGAERTFGYPAVAERFADAGYAALLFDHPEFGESDGDSQAVELDRQRAAYAAAIDRAKRVDAVGDDLVLWGASLSAGHVLTLAAARRDVDAVVGLVPMLDGRAIALRRGGRYLLRSGAAGLRDLLGHRIGRGRTVPIVGGTEECAAISEPGTKRKYIDLVDRESAWRNETPARSLLGLVRYRPVTRLAEIDAPTLLLAGTDDAIVDAESVADAGERLSRGTVVSMPADHFSVLGADFEGAVGHQLSFLRDALE